MAAAFFSPSTWDKQKKPLPLLAECGSCGLHQHVHSPFMKPTGEGRRQTLIVAEAPGENEDDKGIQLVGNAGNELIRILHGLGVNMRKDCWLTNALICRPMDDAGDNRKPEPKEIAWCRPNLRQTIERLKPNVIIPMGEPACRSLMALAWKDGEVDDIGTWVGWDIPCVKLNAWICPTYHPSFLLRLKEPVAELHMVRHLLVAFKHDCKPWPSPPNWQLRCHVVASQNVAVSLIDEAAAREDKVQAFDFETTTLKPDGPHARILCCSISDGVTSFAFPWCEATATAMKRFVQSPVPKVAANLKFEDRWCRRFLKTGVRNWHWDTCLGAHWRNAHGGVTSLKFQAFVLLGVPDYSSHLDSYMKAKDERDSNSPNRLAEVEPAVLMEYCAVDSLLEMLVFREQTNGRW